jgi:molybdate transport system ATP-binding protein
MTLRASFTKSYPRGATVRAELELPLAGPEVTVLYGPSGCGKTTVLRCLAGLERPEAGFIQAGEATWFSAERGIQVPAHRRGIGLVFQDALLFPHLSVEGNIAFGLKGLPRAERARRIATLAGLMGLESLLHRRPRELSGGQKQWVALARALAPRPGLVLLDEPFVSLDRPAAELLRLGLRQILHALGVPAILVTHDPMEALTLGDRMLLMGGGRVLREGAPSLLLPQAGEGEEGLGTVVRARVAGRTQGLLRLEAGPLELFAPDPGGDFQEAYACIRGEGISLERGPHGALTQRNRAPATILDILPLGALSRVRLDAGVPLEALVTTWACQDLGLEPGQEVHALIKASAIRTIPIPG